MHSDYLWCFGFNIRQREFSSAHWGSFEIL